MTVMVITMMQSEQLYTLFNDKLFLSGVLTGIISGIVVTSFSWWFAHILLSPKIRISKDIAYKKVQEKRPKKDSNGKILKDSKGKPIEEIYFATVYRFKIANNAFRNAFDINIFLRIRYKGQYAVFQAPYQPFLNKKRIKPPLMIQKILGYRETYQNHRLIPFRMTNIRMAKIEGFKDEEKLKEKHSNGELCMDDFKNEDTIFEIIINAVDSLSGSALRVISHTYTQEDLDKHVKEGEFLDGEMFVRTKQQTKTPSA